MTKITTLHPPRDLLAKWGVLAHVDEAERKRILDLPHGQTPKAIKLLTKEVDNLKFPRKKKSIVTNSWYNPKNKPYLNKEPNHDEPEPV